MPKFHSLKVKDIRRETADCVSVSFVLPAELQPEYAFLQGQHLTLKTVLDGQEVRRSYSICQSPRHGELRVAVKKVDDGRFSSFVNDQLQPGDVLDVMTPMGSFHTLLDPDQSKHYVAFAAGSGITPIISILKAVLETEPQSRFTLFYGNKNTEAIIFREELDGLKNSHLQRLTIHHFLSREDPGADLFHGRLTGDKIRQVFDKILSVSDADEFFICGPEIMMLEIREVLLDLGVASSRIHFELFTSPTERQKGAVPTWTPPPQPVFANIQITIDNKTFDFDLTSSGSTILDEAIHAGADLPFACKGGVCCTCKAKVLQGEVEMEVNYGLEQEEVAAGYVLTCQSHPKSPKVVLTFDE